MTRVPVIANRCKFCDQPLYHLEVCPLLNPCTDCGGTSRHERDCKVRAENTRRYAERTAEWKEQQGKLGIGPNPVWFDDDHAGRFERASEEFSRQYGRDRPHDRGRW